LPERPAPYQTTVPATPYLTSPQPTWPWLTPADLTRPDPG